MIFVWLALLLVALVFFVYYSVRCVRALRETADRKQPGTMPPALMSALSRLCLSALAVVVIGTLLAAGVY